MAKQSTIRWIYAATWLFTFALLVPTDLSGDEPMFSFKPIPFSLGPPAEIDLDGQFDESSLEDVSGSASEVTFADLILLSPFEAEDFDEAEFFYRETSPIRKASMIQQTPLLLPSITVSADETPSASAFGTAALTAASVRLASRRRLRTDRTTSNFQVDRMLGAESAPLSTTDVGSLLKKSNVSLSTRVQKRNPVVNDPRVRGSRIGALAASGSYWVPARADLDTVVSKIDSRLIDDVVVTPGPYTSLLGPGFQFIDFQLLSSPRYSGGPEMHGSSALNYGSNGDHFLAQQSLMYGSATWGVHGSYVHRTGNDYVSGDGSTIAGDYKSREWVFGVGSDLGNNKTIELSLIRLDQTDVDFPGYVFDIDALVTDGYDIKFADNDPLIADAVETDIWYNRTRFSGNAQDPQKRIQFPSLDAIAYEGFTDVDSLSTGYRRSRFWGDERDDWRLIAGHDLRFVKQELNEISSSIGFPFNFINVNSPIPRSFSVNPGVFLEYDENLSKQWNFKAGGRLDYVGTDIVDDPSKLTDVGSHFFPLTYEEIVGTSQKQTDRMLGSVFATLTRQYSDELVGSVSIGFAQRAPTLTELYAAEPFLLLLQNGLNIVTGDPRLDKESVLQCDATIDHTSDSYRWGARAFHSWAYDYITVENTDVVFDFMGNVNQVNLRYVNTDLATFTGFEFFAQAFTDAVLSPYINMAYVDARDRTRNGSFATQAAVFGASQRVAGLSRGAFSGVAGAGAEPLPGISPLEVNVGVRITDPSPQQSWNLEINTRVVDNQDRVATSLLESTTPGFTVYDLRGNLRPSRFDHVLLVAGIENLTDKRYQEHLDFRSQDGPPVLQSGFNFYFGTDIQY